MHVSSEARGLKPGPRVIQRILHECSCFIEFIERVGEKR